jgi:Ca-activated chloride channel family protein
MSEFHFLRPEWFWALIPLAALVLWWSFHHARGGQWRRLVDPALQPHVLTGGAGRRGRAGPWIFALAGLLTVTALAGPAWERLPQPVFKDRSALVIGLDLSRSMLARDLAPSRLERAKLKGVDILRARRTGQTALVAFAAGAFTVTPLTDDVETITAHVSDLDVDLMPAQGSRPDRAVDKAMELFDNTGIRHGRVLLITDGGAPRRGSDRRPSLPVKPDFAAIPPVRRRRDIPNNNGGFGGRAIPEPQHTRLLGAMILPGQQPIAQKHKQQQADDRFNQADVPVIAQQVNHDAPHQRA